MWIACLEFFIGNTDFESDVFETLSPFEVEFDQFFVGTVSKQVIFVVLFDDIFIMCQQCSNDDTLDIIPRLFGQICLIFIYQYGKIVRPCFFNRLSQSAFPAVVCHSGKIPLVKTLM